MWAPPVYEALNISNNDVVIVGLINCSYQIVDIHATFGVFRTRNIIVFMSSFTLPFVFFERGIYMYCNGICHVVCCCFFRIDKMFLSDQGSGFLFLSFSLIERQYVSPTGSLLTNNHMKFYSTLTVFFFS